MWTDATVTHFSHTHLKIFNPSPHYVPFTAAAVISVIYIFLNKSRIRLCRVRVISYQLVIDAQMHQYLTPVSISDTRIHMFLSHIVSAAQVWRASAESGQRTFISAFICQCCLSAARRRGPTETSAQAGLLTFSFSVSTALTGKINDDAPVWSKHTLKVAVLIDDRCARACSAETFIRRYLWAVTDPLPILKHAACTGHTISLF